MKEIFPRDIFTELTDPIRKPTQNPAAGLWAGFAIMALILVVGFFWLGQISNAMKPGLAHYEQGDYAAAETDFRKFTQNPWTAQEPSGHYYLGLCLLHEGRFEDARTEMEWTDKHSGGKGTVGLNHRAEKLLQALEELPASPTAAQIQQWQLKYLTQHQGQ